MRIEHWSHKIVRKPSKHETAQMRRILKNSRAAVVGWCLRYRPESDPKEWELRVGLYDRPMTVFVSPVDGDESGDEDIGPYTIDEILRFMAEGKVAMATTAILSGSPVSEKSHGWYL